MGESSQPSKLPIVEWFHYRRAAKERGMTLDEYLDSLIEPFASEAGMSIDEYVKHKIEEMSLLPPPETE